MGSLSTGGGSSAVAASAHAGCERYRHTDPLLTGRSRRTLAKEIGHPDTTAGIPEARWMRAMAFERLIRHERFVAELLTTAVGQLSLERPPAVRRADGGVSVATTRLKLAEAHTAAVNDGVATMITSLALPFVGMEDVASATPVKPDFAIVVARTERGGDGESAVTLGSWLVMGDAKDYERVRSRIDDQRMLKGFLQVALGAESAAAWSLLPDGMEVHEWGALAVPRNAFLQPEAIVERLADHRREVRSRVDERAELLERLGCNEQEDAGVFVEQLRSTYDPASCAACALFQCCRTEVRSSGDPGALLTEVGVRPELRHAALSVLNDSDAGDAIPASVRAGIRATIDGTPVWTGQRRVDLAGRPGSINVVLAKSDAAALGVHGMGLQRVGADGRPGAWKFTVFDDPQAASTRLAVTKRIGIEIARAKTGSSPICLVTPDGQTGDVLVSLADSLAGVETSRLRWERDLAMRRPALTFNGEQAVVPEALTDEQRTAVSFLLEEDRARAMLLRSPIVDLRRVLSRHLVAGGPVSDSGRLDYLVAWGEAHEPLDHRTVADDVAAQPHTPGARLANDLSDRMHVALRGRRDRHGRSGTPDLAAYRKLVGGELEYKANVLDRALQLLDQIPDSQLRPAHVALEADAQAVWRRRLRLHASDLVRFGRTTRPWRNRQVELRDADRSCAAQLELFENPQAALDLAVSAGTREVALAIVTSTDPIRLAIRSRRIGDGSVIVAVHRNGSPVIENGAVSLTVQTTSFKLEQMHLGPLVDDDAGNGLIWEVGRPIDLALGDRVIVADRGWFKSLTTNHHLPISRPGVDCQNAPKADCDEDSSVDDPIGHQWCCRSHEDSEAEYSDQLAGRRARGELNPQAWPPVIDEDQFDSLAAGSPTDATIDASDPRPTDLTIDDLD